MALSHLFRWRPKSDNSSLCALRAFPSSTETHQLDFHTFSGGKTIRHFPGKCSSHTVAQSSEAYCQPSLIKPKVEANRQTQNKRWTSAADEQQTTGSNRAWTQAHGREKRPTAEHLRKRPHLCPTGWPHTPPLPNVLQTCCKSRTGSRVSAESPLRTKHLTQS